ncbi:unnamed protein product [Blepharisma stoltei]|uniref:Uncharacterized protein n=1 Tax=Blepharisma stoltei TaxID=1481888 RepID=A0AAU9J743_9CILI|nr:unnamed protein product [Blepharisma stoltei]
MKRITKAVETLEKHFSILSCIYAELLKLSFQLENLKKRKPEFLGEIVERDYFQDLASLHSLFVDELKIPTFDSNSSHKQLLNKLQYFINKSKLQSYADPNSFNSTLSTLNRALEEKINLFKESKAGILVIIDSLTKNESVLDEFSYETKELLRHKNETIIYYHHIKELIEIKPEARSQKLKEIDKQFIVLQKLHLATIATFSKDVKKVQENEEEKNECKPIEEASNNELKELDEETENNDMWCVIEGEGGKDQKRKKKIQTEDYITEKIGEQTIEELKTKLKQPKGPVLYKAVDPETGKVTTSQEEIYKQSTISAIAPKEINMNFDPVPHVSMNSLMSELKQAFKVNKESLPSI